MTIKRVEEAVYEFNGALFTKTGLLEYAEYRVTTVLETFWSYSRPTPLPEKAMMNCILRRAADLKKELDFLLEVERITEAEGTAALEQN